MARVKLRVGMLLLDPATRKVYTVSSPGVLIREQDGVSERHTLLVRGAVPEGWQVLDNRGVAKRAMEELARDRPA
jgi:hypothetical protein